jgi:putative aldouronate transport system substrate-binding protein
LSTFIILNIVTLILFASCHAEKSEGRVLTFYSHRSGYNYPENGDPARTEIIKKAAESGLKFDYSVTHIGGKAYEAHLKQALMSDKSPMAFDISYNQIREYVKYDLILPLTAYLDQMTTYKKYVKEEDLKRFTYNGELYAFPSAERPGSGGGGYTMGWSIRTDWLENLDLSMPETIGELEEVLRAFTEDDPDGNGLNDTTGLTSDLNFSMIWGAFGLAYTNPESSWIDQPHEKVCHISLLPQVKEILMLLQSWYNKGYICKLGFSNSRSDLMKQNKVGIASLSIWENQSIREFWDNKDKNYALSSMPAVSGPKGYAGYPVKPAVDEALALSADMSDEEIKTMISFLNWITDDTEKGGFMMVTYGIEDIHYNYDRTSDKIHLLNKKSPYSELRQSGFSNPIRFIPITDRRWIEADEMLDDIKILNSPENIMVSPLIEPVNISREILDLITYRWPELFLGVITGEKTLNDWNVYMRDFKRECEKQ